MMNWQHYWQQRRNRGDGPLTIEDAAQELLARRLARKKFIDFAQYANDHYKPDPFHIKLGEIFDQVVSGELQFVIIKAPPQHGKSTAASEILPAFWLGNRPNDPVIISSYNADLAHAKSREARKIVQGEAFINAFGKHATRDDPPVDISDSSAAVDNWRLEAPYRGGVRATGVGGGLTGHAAMLGIIDDPLKGIEEANSATIRESVWAWYQTVFRTRINEGGAIVIILTPWHPEDLVGKLQAMAGVENADKFKVFRFPAIAETQEVRDANNRFLGLPPGEADPLGREPGEPLAPRRFSLQSLLALKGSILPHYWGALYDGVPRSRDGNWIKRDWFQIIDPALIPRIGKRVRYWDKAASEDPKDAATAGVLMLKTPDDRIYIEHVVREWKNSGAREDVILQTARSDAGKYGSKRAVQIVVEQEPGSGGKHSAQITISALSKEGFPIKRDLPTGDKDLRLDPFAAYAQLHKVYLAAGVWNEAWLDEITAIPNGQWRDQSDATSGGYNILSDAGRTTTKRSKVTGLPGRGQRRVPFPHR
jgi:predicted phage terminase large subunit-like protein